MPDLSLLRGASLVFVAALLASPASAGAASAAPAPLSAAVTCDDTRDTWGIDVVRIFATASGAMLDFLFRVIDPEKAAPLFGRRTKAYLVNEVTKRALAVPDAPKTGPLRNTGHPEAGRTYFMVFSNLDRAVRRGDP